MKAEVEEHYGKTTPDFRCAEYEDFRVMLEKEKAIDAVLCATPDHAHAVVSIAAMKLGKHVYCEKPLTHNVWEARQVAKVAKETGVATQMGNHGHSGEGIRQTCEWIWDGAIGPVREVHAWSDTGKWATTPGRPKETPPVPAGLNWDLWLGPREPRPYHPAYAPYNWRGWWAFGTGAIGDMACHNIDPAVWALKLEHPLRVEATTSALDDEVASPAGAIHTLSLRAARRHAAGDLDVVRRRTAPAHAGGHRSQRRQAAVGRGGQRDPVHRRQGHDHLRRLGGHAPAAAAVAAPRVQASRKDLAAQPRASRRLAGRVQGRPAGQRQLRVQRPPDRTGLAGERRLADEEAALVGRAQP